MSRTLIVGDIHGCLDELKDLVDAAELTSDDQLLAVGDIVDRGPDSIGVLAHIRDQPNASSIQGNHERKHVRSFAGSVRPARSQLIVRQQIGEERYPETCAYLDSLPRWADLDDVLVVHGFYEPGLPVHEQRERVIVGTLGGEMHLRKRYDKPWFELYDGEKPLVVGHHDYRRDGQPFVYRDRVFGLDTSCVHGSRLTGLLVPEFRFVSVPSRGDHWRAQQALYKDIKRPPAPRDAVLWSQFVEGKLDEPAALSFDILARLRSVADEQADDEAVAAAAAPLYALERECAEVVEAVSTALLAQSEAALATLRAEADAAGEDYDALPKADQGKRFSDHIGAVMQRALLQKARLRRLDGDTVRRAQKTPEGLRALREALRA